MRKLVSLCPLLLCAFSSAQVTHVAVEMLNQDGNKINYRLTNNSDKALTCYSVAVDITYNDGKVDTGQSSECQNTPGGILAPQASLERTTGLGSNASGVAKIAIEPSLAIFEDGSKEVRDAHSWHILIDSLQSDSDGQRDAIATIKQFTNDPAKALTALQALREKASPKSPYDYRLNDAITFLKKNPSPADLTKYLDHLQKDYTQKKPYADPGRER
jgi:hypothetical protein